MTVPWRQGQNSAYETLRTVSAEVGAGALSATWPRPLAPGDTVGVAALSGEVDPQRLALGTKALRDFGFRVREAPNLRSRWHHHAGTDAERMAGLYDLSDDPEVAAIVFARGGHGVLRVIDSLDWSRLGRHPRAYVGYSDLTPFLLGVVDRLGLVAFHGPMVAADLARGLDPEEAESFLGCLGGAPTSTYPCARFRGRDAVEGPLLGGCLSLVVATLGGAWLPELEASILFLEDTHEPRYRLDRMLAQLRLSGALGKVAGLVLGDLGATDIEPGDLREALAVGLEGSPDLAVCLDLPCSHAAPNLTLPLGARYRLSPEQGTLELLTPPLHETRARTP